MLALSRADGGNWTGEQLPAWVTFEGAFQHQARVTRLAGTHFFGGGLQTTPPQPTSSRMRATEARRPAGWNTLQSVVHRHACSEQRSAHPGAFPTQR